MKKAIFSLILPTLLGTVVTNATAGITFDATSSAASGSPASPTVTWSHTVGSGLDRMLVVGVSAESTSNLPALSVTYGGAALTHVTGSRAAAISVTTESSDLWYLAAPVVGTASIVVTFDPAFTNTFPTTGAAACGAVSLFGVIQGDPEAVAINSTASTTNAFATSITTLTSGACLVDVVCNGSGFATFTGSPGTKQWDLPAATNGICSGGGATLIVTNIGLVKDSWTYGASHRWAQSIASFAPSTPFVSPVSANITSPTDGASVSTTKFTINADASVSPGTVTNLSFYVDSTRVGNVTAQPYSFVVNGAAAGAHVLTVVATDSGGNSATSGVVNVTALNFAPFVAITNPANGNAVLTGATVPLGAVVADDGTVTNVTFYVDGTPVGSATASPFASSWASATAGAHQLTAIAYDNGGLSSTSAVVNITGYASFNAYEPFNYGSLADGTPSTATGFTGNWSCAGGAIVSGLNYPNLTTANSALNSSGGRNSVSFAAPLSSGTEWVSFVINQTGDPGGVKNGVYFLNGGTGLFCGFGLAPFTATQGKIGLAPINTIGTGYLNTGTSLGTSTAELNYTTNYLIVLKIAFNTSGNNDTVTVYVNPNTQTNVPGVSAALTVSSFDVGTITGIGLNAGNTSFTLDEIRRARTYAEVVGGSSGGGGGGVNASPTNIITSVSGNQLTLSWPADHTGWTLQAQTNSLNPGSWSDVGGSTATNQVTVTIDPVNPEVFYRLKF